MVLKYDFYQAPFPVITKKSAVGWIQPILEINNSHTLPFQKKSIGQALHLDLLDLLLKYRSYGHIYIYIYIYDHFHP